MSFEGYYQLICANGHARAADVYSTCLGDEPFMRCHCGAEFTQENLVDQTNGCEGSPCQCGELELVEVEAPVFETCNLGHHHQKTPGRYTFGEKVTHVLNNEETRQGEG